MPLDGLQKTFQCGEILSSEDLNSIIQAINNTVTTVNTMKNNLEGHQYDVSVPITSIYCRTKKGINASGFFPQSDIQKATLFEQVTSCQLTQGIKYATNFLTVTLDNVADNMNGVWTAYPQGISEELPHEWEASFKKLEDSNEIIFMFGPVLVSNYGYSGADGDGVQYVYKLFNRELTDQERTANIPTKPASPNQNGEYIPYGWTDDPQGPTEEYPYEYVATLKRTNGSWGDFEKISIWSTYSKDGVNGDFQTRVFCRFTPTVLKPSPNAPIGGTYDSPQPGSNDSITWSMTVPSGDGLVWTSIRTFKGNGTATNWSAPVIESDSNELDIEYSSSITKPNIDTLRGTPGVPHPSNNVWHDPSESGIDLSAMIWRAERKIKNGKFEGNWVISRLTGKQGSFKSMVFRRFIPTIQQSVPPYPSGGTFANPIPTGWYDGIPDGDGPIWSSTCTFTEEDIEPVSALRWSQPQIQQDSTDLDIEFSPGIGEEHTQPSNPTGEPFSNRQSQGWYDPSASNFNSVGPMIWRAERKVVNGVYEGAWTVTRIFGEKGEEGKRGEFKSFVFKRSQNVISSVTSAEDAEVTYENPIPINWSDTVPTNSNDTLWMAVSKFSGVGNNHTVWTVTQQSDSRDLDIEFSTSTTEPEPPEGTPFQNRSSLGWYNAGSIPQGSRAIWRAERKVYDGQFRQNDPWVVSRIWGERGVDATLSASQVEALEKVGLSIVINPSTIILDQSGILTNANDSTHITPITSIITLYQNNTAIPSSDYAIVDNSVDMFIEGSNQAVANDNNKYFTEVKTGNTKSITINNLPISTDATKNPNEYYYTKNRGYIRGTIVVAINENSYNIPFQIPWYLNKLGERESKILGDIETTYMSRDIFSQNGDTPNNSTILQRLNGMIQIGAEGTLEQYSLITSNGDLNVPTSSEFGEYQRTASQNLSNLKKTISGTNLITDNWLQLNSQTITSGSGTTTTRKATKVSPQIPLSQGIYILSWYSTETSPNNFKISIGTSSSKIDNISYITDSNITWTYNSIDNTTNLAGGGRLSSNSTTGYEGDYYTRTENSSNVTYVRYYSRFVVSNDDQYYSFVISLSNSSSYNILRPQLELCLESNTDQLPTPWVPGPQDFSSEIKQTAESIRASVASQESVSALQITAEGIQGQVTALQKGKNMFSGALTGINWRSCPQASITLHNITINSNYEISKGDENDYYIVSPEVSVEVGKTYTVSFIPPSSDATQIKFLSGGNFINVKNTSDTSVNVLYSESGERQSVTFKILASKTDFRVCFARGNIKMPQMELGSSATAFNVEGGEIASQIKQTADSISSTVTGINGRLTTVEQNSNSITSQVTQLQKGKNIFKGSISGSNWNSFTTAPFTRNQSEQGVTIDSNGFITAESNQTWIFQSVTLTKNVDYVISFYGNITTAISYKIFTDVLTGDSTPLISSSFNSVSSISTRRTSTFNIEGSGNINAVIAINTTKIQYPQLELGTVATEFEVSFAEIGSKITQDINNINLNVTGVTANQLATAGIHLSAGNGDPGTITLNAENFSLVDSNNNLVFGKESGSSNLTFTGDIKNGTSGDGFDGAYTNEIRADGTGNLGGRLIEWDPDYGLYIGPGPSSGYENYDVMSDTYTPSGDDYNGDGIRVFPNGRIHFQGQMDGNFKFGKIRMEGDSGRISIYGEGVDSTHREHNILLSKYGLTIKPQVFTSSEDILENGAQSAYNKTDAGAISFGSTPNVGASNAINWNNPNVPANQSIVGDTGSTKKYNQRIYIKGCDGFIYQGYTGISNNLCFINGICIGPSSSFNNSGDYMNMNILFPS